MPRYFCLLLSCVALFLSAFKNRAVHLCTVAVSLGCLINIRGECSCLVFCSCEREIKVGFIKIAGGLDPQKRAVC